MSNTIPEVREACAALCEIDILEQLPEFASFMDRIKAVADKMADAVLHNEELTADKREAIRQQRIGVLEVLKFPNEIKVGQQRVLAMAGIKLEDQLPEES